MAAGHVVRWNVTEPATGAVIRASGQLGMASGISGLSP